MSAKTSISARIDRMVDSAKSYCPLFPIRERRKQHKEPEKWQLCVGWTV